MPGKRLSAIERAGLVRLVDTIPGMTDFDKIDAMIEIMPSMPPGDIVEIGSWWGRSAALSLLLARRYGIGPVLCVDPWRNACLDQGVPILDQASARLDADHALDIFRMNLSPLVQGDLNYIRATAAEAAAAYGPGLAVTTESFGTTIFGGTIALLHIDGKPCLRPGRHGRPALDAACAPRRLDHLRRLCLDLRRWSPAVSSRSLPREEPRPYRTQLRDRNCLIHPVGKRMMRGRATSCSTRP